jgi:hypothetical protein
MAMSSPLLEETSITGAKGVLLNIVGGPDLTMTEINEAATLIHKACDTDAEIIFGAVTDEKMTGSVTVTVIATGFTTPSRELAEEESNVQAFPERRDRPNPNQRTVTQNKQARLREAYRSHKDPMRTGDFNEGASTESPPIRARRVNGLKSEPDRKQTSKQGKPEVVQMHSERPEPAPQRMEAEPAAEFQTPRETIQEVLMTPQSFGANNMGFSDENDLDIPTYLRNMKRIKK